MWKKFFAYCAGVGIITVVSESNADSAHIDAASSVDTVSLPAAKQASNATYVLLPATSSDIIGLLLENVQKYAKANPSVSAKEIYDHVKTLHFDMKTKEELNACNFIMSYFRAQSNDQSGNVIRQKLDALLEGMLWLERKKHNRLSVNYLTDFRIVSFLVSEEVFPHLTLNNMKLVLNEVKKYRDEASQRAALSALTAEGGTLLPHIIDEKQVNDAQLTLDHFQGMISNVASIKNGADAKEQIIKLTNQLNTLKRGEFEVDGKKYKYPRNMRKQLEYHISNKIASLMLYINNLEH